MSFPADIKGCMKDCILSLFWPRKDIVGFFEKHGCTKAEVGRLQIEGENGLTFDAELRKIIYSHVPPEDQLGQPSMDALLKFKVAEINKAMEALRGQITALNVEILSAEGQLFPEFRKGLVEQLAAKKAVLTSLDEAQPKPVEDPNASPEALEESKQAAAVIDGLEQQLQAAGKEETGLREAKSAAAKKQAIARRIVHGHQR